MDNRVNRNAHSIPGETHPAYLIPKSIRRRLARAKVWGPQSVDPDAAVKLLNDHLSSTFNSLVPLKSRTISNPTCSA
uniref:Uncharacterized protein n=1 Tax=Callorhinchus milii TaxID=7868 RepID=A0A4W3KH23_CALMI